MSVPKTCDDYVLNKLFSTEAELDEMQTKYLKLKAEHQKALDLIEVIKNHAKVQYSTIWLHLYDVKDRQQLLDALELKEEDKPNE